MTIRRKTFIINGLTLLSLLLALYAASSRVLLNGFARVEESNALDDARRVVGAVEETVAKLNGTASDWANWDDTYEYILNRNSKYAQANLRVTSISTLDLNLMMLLRPSGEIVFGTGFDKKKGHLKRVPRGVLQLLKERRLPLGGGSLADFTSGIIMLPEGPMFIVSRPILTSEKKGPSRGTLIMGRNLDAEELKRLSLLTRFSLDIRSYAQASLPRGYREARSKLTENSPILIQTEDESTTGGYVLLYDIYRQPALLLKISIPRDIYKQGIRSLIYLSVASMIVCLGISWVTFFLLQKLVLSRLDSLMAEVRNITSSRDITHRIPSFGSDELGMLAAAMNEMLAAEQLAHEKSLASENRFRAFMDNSPTVAFMKDAGGRYIYVNDRFEQVFQKTQDQVIGKSDHDLWPPEVARVIRENDIAVLEKNIFMQLEESTPTALKGETWWLSFKFPFLDAAGQQVLAGVSMDITERKAVERMKSEFVSTVSHELRTPLTAIRGALGIIIGGVSGEIPEQAKSLLSLAHKNTERLGRLINDILDIEAIESGKMTVSLQALPLMPAIENALELNTPYSNEFGVAFNIEAALPLAEVYVDKDRLTQVLINLLANAAKFSPRGEAVSVRVTRLESEGKKTQIRVSITNRGPEIPPEFRGRIFEKFAQADSSDARQKGGTGLGLNISKAIVERFGGTIGFTSNSKETTFYFDLPEYRQRTRDSVLSSSNPALNVHSQ